MISINKNKEEFIFLGLLIIPITWLAILIAPYMDQGLIYALSHFSEALNHPFDLHWSSNTFKAITIFMIAYVLGIGIYLSSPKNYRRQQEYGSARWANPNSVCKKYANKDYFENKIFSQNVRMGLDGKKHRRNLNTIVIGGSGAGKTRFYAKPNILQCNTSFVVLDPNGIPCDGSIIRKGLSELEKEAGLPHVVFHSLRHTSTTYKLKLNNGDIKATQGDTGHSQADMVMDLYSHILDEDRRVNAQKFEDSFYKQHMENYVDVPQANTKVDIDKVLEKIKQDPDLLQLLIATLSGN